MRGKRIRYEKDKRNEHQFRRIRIIIEKGGYQVQHIFHEVNQLTDFLANNATTYGREMRYTRYTLPTFVNGLVILDFQSFPIIHVKHKVVVVILRMYGIKPSLCKIIF